MDKKAFKRFVSNRWLSMVPVCHRIIKNWLSLIEYFLNTKQTKSIKKSSMFITLTHSQRIFASLQYAGATARCKHCRHIESANRKWSYNIHGRPIVFNLTRENE